MNCHQRLLLCGFSFLLGEIFLPTTVSAQSVTSDRTLSTTVTSPDNRNFTITNGNQPNNGANLFHSFSQFSIPTGGSATFDLINTPNISTIFSRVTGGNISNIDGLIRTLNSNNPVSLFLLNPSGIIFGANAKLNIGGSFIGTTANSIKFADGTEFSAVNPTISPLLTVSAPLGLNFENNSGAIDVQGSGSKLIVPSVGPISSMNTPIGLRVNVGNTLALIGGAVNFSGGIIATNGGGYLEVGSVSVGEVELKPTAQGLIGDYAAVQQFGDIRLAQQSLINASGSNGSIQLQGRNISLTDGSTVLIQSFGAQPSQNTTVRATESLQLIGSTPDSMGRSLIQVDNLGTSRSGDINISTPQLLLQNGGTIRNGTFTAAPSGDVTINAGLLNVDGVVPINPTVVSLIATGSFGSGKAGDLIISADKMRILNGGSVASIAFRSGGAGKVFVNVSDLLEVAGQSPITFSPSALTSTTFSSGNAGDLLVNIARLTIRAGGAIGVSTAASGSAGNVTINASEFVDISGKNNGSIAPSRISSSALRLDPITQFIFNLPAIPTGDSGSVIINTPSLRITDGALATVRNDGPGKAGSLQINATSIFLNNQGGITASTSSGNGGDIRLNLQSSLLLGQNSLISATAAGNGNGGNLTIKSPVIVGLENSDIIANAVQGIGGNIAINTQGLFGLKSRLQLTPESDITASSQFGLSGTVNISNLAFSPTSGLIELPTDVIDPSQRIVQGCRTYGNSRFVATGRGGLHDDPSDRLSSPHPWTDLRDPSTFRNSATLTTARESETSTPPIVEATGWRINAKGTVDIYATNSVEIERVATNCAGLPVISTQSLKKR